MSQSQISLGVSSGPGAGHSAYLPQLPASQPKVIEVFFFSFNDEFQIPTPCTSKSIMNGEVPIRVFCLVLFSWSI